MKLKEKRIYNSKGLKITACIVPDKYYLTDFLKYLANFDLSDSEIILSFKGNPDFEKIVDLSVNNLCDLLEDGDFYHLARTSLITLINCVRRLGSFNADGTERWITSWHIIIQKKGV